MSRKHKWPVKALNLLVALAMVIALVAMLAPAVAAQPAPCPVAVAPDSGCDPVERFPGICNLEVFITIYEKDTNGDFTAVTEVDEEDCFYVNAVVVNTGDTVTADPIYAEIDLTDPNMKAELASCDGNDMQQTGTGACAPGDMQDFWWKVCCNGTGTGMITVNVVDALDTPTCTGTKTVSFTQTVPDLEKCIEVKIIEAPGLTELSGDQGWYDQAYPLSPFEQTVVPCTNFGIKAKITNYCDTERVDVNGTIRWGMGYRASTDKFDDPAQVDPVANEDTTLEKYASIVGGDPLEWCVGTLQPLESAIVAWTLHCDEPGDIEILVQAWEDACGSSGTTLHEETIYVNNPWTVKQQGAGELEVVILSPVECQEILNSDPQCPATVPITVRTTNNGDLSVENILTTIVANETIAIWEFVGQTFTFTPLLAPTESVISNFTGKCKGPGPVMLTATASGTIVGGGAVAATPDVVNILQTDVQATLPASATGWDYTYTRPIKVNKCETFEIIGSFYNKTSEDLVGVVACIYWSGNATLMLPASYPPASGYSDADTTIYPVFDRCLGSPGWRLFTGADDAGVLNTVVGNNSTYCYNCQTIPICNCCESRVKWNFQCNDTDVDPSFYVTMSWTDGVDTYFDTSLMCASNLTPSATCTYPDCEIYPYTVIQEYKAHLVVGQFTFLQTECGAMLNRTAFAPCQNFHVVIPVVNVGEADSQSTVVNFSVTPVDFYDFVSVSGDVTDYTFNETTGLGSATLGTVYGNSMKKVIVQLHCASEGAVNILVTGAAGIDENTGAAIHGSNIELPPCPLAVQQIPFTVEILNPEECETYNPGDRFAVKALITNGSENDLHDVSATLHWYGNAMVVDPQTYTGGTPCVITNACSSTKTIGNDTDNDNLLAGQMAEITWVMECTQAGEVYLWVTSTAEEEGVPYLTATSDEVNVHQADRAKIEVLILSPDDPYIFTSQEFAVTAQVMNNGTIPAEDVQLILGCESDIGTGDAVTKVFSMGEYCVTPGQALIWVDGVLMVEGVDYVITQPGVYTDSLITFTTAPSLGAVITGNLMYLVEIIEGDQVIDVGTMAAGQVLVFTWTLHAWTACEYTCDDEDTCVHVYATASNADGDDDCTDPTIYPAAHLEAEITSITPASPFLVCDEFVVNYTITNTGEADSWETSATLSVNPEGSVRIAAGPSGYTQYIGTLASYDMAGKYPNVTTWEPNDNVYTGSFTLHCKQACESTITITPAGRDECGVEEMLIFEGVVNPNFWDGDGWYEVYDDDVAGAPIPNYHIEAVSWTVKQIESGGLDLGIGKYVDDAYPEIEQTVEFTVIVTNFGPTDASGVEVTDILDADLTFVSATASQGSYSSGTGIWTVGTVVSGASATLKIMASVDSTDEIVNTAMISDVDQPDAFDDNDSASVTLNKMAPTSADIELDADWNLISLPLIPDVTAVVTFFSGIASNLDVVWAYDAATATWSSYAPSGPTPSLTAVADGKGYWIKMDYADTLSFTGVELKSGNVLPPSYAVSVGWNLMGFKSTTLMAAGDYLNAIEGKWNRIYGYANGSYVALQADDMMMPGYGFWLAANATGTIYP